jgi:predicted RNA-binding protein (virulence factor B family)
MVRIGKKCILDIVKFTEQGAYLDGGPYGEILLPKRYVPLNSKVDDEIEVFISFDSEDRILATTDMPYAMVGDFAGLEVAQVNQVGAFLDWGLPKDLFVPFREQFAKMEKGKRYVVYVYVDEKTGRIAASAKIKKFASKEPFPGAEGDEVDLLIAAHSELGYSAIINNSHLGMIFNSEVFKSISVGDKLKGFIKLIRPDGKIDLSLEKEGYEKIDPISDQIIEAIKSNNGTLPLSDNSSPDEIKKILGISKKSFKKAIGLLYKNRLIAIYPDKIEMIKKQ